MNNRTRILMTMATALFAASAAADTGEPAGMIKTRRGSVSVDRAGQQLDAPLGMAVFPGDRLRTGRDSAVGVTLRDDTRMSAGPDSTMLISEFRFNTTTHEGSMLAALLKGTFSIVTGLIAKQSPRNVNFTTPTLSLGVRGTAFIVEVEQAAP